MSLIRIIVSKTPDTLPANLSGFPIGNDYIQLVAGGIWKPGGVFTEDDIINLYHVPGTNYWSENGTTTLSETNKIRILYSVKTNVPSAYSTYYAKITVFSYFPIAACSFKYSNYSSAINGVYPFKALFNKNLYAKNIYSPATYLFTTSALFRNQDLFKSMTYING